MPAFSTVVRSLPPEMMHSYLLTTDPALVSDREPGAPDSLYRRRLIDCYRDWRPELRERIDKETGRVWTLTDELGQEALFGLWPNRAELDALGSGPARAMHVFQVDPKIFGLAESSRFADYGRYGQSWTMANCHAGLTVARQPEAVSAYTAAVREHFEISRVHVEIYDRIRPTLDRDPDHLVQANVYREGRTDEQWDLGENGELNRVPRRSVLEAAVTYEPRTGTVEAVCPRRPDRRAVVAPFCVHLLGTEYREARRREREYDLSRLLTRHAFPTHAYHGIESVRVVQLRLVRHSSRSEIITLEVPQGNPRDIWTVAEQSLSSPLSGWNVLKARIAIQLRADSTGRPARTLNVTISAPYSCDLKSRSNDERVVGEYYLREWGLLRGPRA